MKSLHNLLRSGDYRWHTKTDLAYHVLREAIHSGLFAPGEHIPASKVAHELGMSGIPVREALRRLEQERLVNIRPHAGATVRPLPANELTEIILIRGELEGLATRLAAPRMTDGVLRTLESLVERMDRCVRERSLELGGQLNREFHLTIYGVIPQRRLYDLIEALWDEIPRARSLFAIVPGYAEASQRDHRRILHALKARDGGVAEERMRAHKRFALQVLATHLQAAVPGM